jgi:uncharacterized membrane protein
MSKNRFLYRGAAILLMAVLAGCASARTIDSQGSEAVSQAGVPGLFYTLVTWSMVALEAAGVLAILFGFLAGMFYFLRELFRRGDMTREYYNLRERLGRAILLGLEFLVAADIVNTVAVEPSFENLAVLGLVVLIRTFLSFAIEVEIHGHWPWEQYTRKEAGVGLARVKKTGRSTPDD